MLPPPKPRSQSPTNRFDPPKAAVLLRTGVWLSLPTRNGSKRGVGHPRLRGCLAATMSSQLHVNRRCAALRGATVELRLERTKRRPQRAAMVQQPGERRLNGGGGCCSRHKPLKAHAQGFISPYHRTLATYTGPKSERTASPSLVRANHPRARDTGPVLLQEQILITRESAFTTALETVVSRAFAAGDLCISSGAEAGYSVKEGGIEVLKHDIWFSEAAAARGRGAEHPPPLPLLARPTRRPSCPCPPARPRVTLPCRILADRGSELALRGSAAARRACFGARGAQACCRHCVAGLAPALPAAPAGETAATQSCRARRTATRCRPLSRC
jgi:hypothetical protein